MRAAVWVAAAAMATVVVFPVLSPLERRAFDKRLALRADTPWPADLTLVPIDDTSVQAVGRWPWPRTKIAELLGKIDEAGAKTVLLDIIFEAKSDAGGDAALREALGKSLLAIGYVWTGKAPGEASVLEQASIAGEPPAVARFSADHFTTPLAPFMDAAAGAGHVALFTHGDGCVRGHAPFVGLKSVSAGIPSLPLLAWTRHRGFDLADARLEGSKLLLPGGRRIPAMSGEVFLDFVPGGKKPRMVSAQDVLAGTPEARAALQGALAVVYVDSVYSLDLVSTPMGPATAGGLVHAYTIRTLESARVPRTVPPFIPLAAVLALVLVSLSRLRLQTPTWLASAGAIAAAGYALLAMVLVPLTDYFLPVALPAFFLALSGVLLAVRTSRVSEVERRRLRSLLDRAMSRALRTDADDLLLTSAPTRIGPDEPPTRPVAGPPGGRRYERASATAGRGSIDSTPLLASTEELLEPVEVGRYLVQRSLGRGGMGAIFLAIDQELARPVAIKVLHAANDTSAFRRFRQEALAVARLSHPNVVQIYEVGFDAAVPYIVMEYVAGGTCSDLLRDPTVPMPLSWERVTRIVEGVAKGLGAAHGMGIVHRDVKPANLLLVQRDGTESKVADFGIAKLGGGETLTREGSFVGTVGYLSPEQARGKPVTASSDVYSLGVTWYKLLTGFSPYEGSTAEVLGAQQHADVPDPREHSPDVPEGVVSVLRQMTMRDPTQRIQNGVAAAAAIAALLRPATVFASRRIP